MCSRRPGAAALMWMMCLALTAVAGGQELLDDARYANDEQARAAWQAGPDTEDVTLAAVDGRPALKFPCTFAARPSAEVQQWQRAVTLDLSGPDRPGIALDVYCPAERPCQPFRVSLGDAKRWATAGIEREQLAPGWNVVRIGKSQMQGEEGLPDWSAIRTVRLSVARAERINTVLHVADLRVLAADPMAALPRPAGADRLEKKDGATLEGTILNDLYGINTPFGPMTFPAGRVVGLQSIGQGTVRLVLTDGQVLRGLPTNNQLRLADLSGRLHEVSAREVALLAYRLSAQRPEQAEPGTAMIVIGESRLAIEGEKLSLTLKTEHGTIDLPPGGPLSIERSEDSKGAEAPRFRVRLRRGSELTGTFASDMCEVHLAGGKSCAVDLRQLVRITWPGRAQVPAGAAVATLRDGGRVVGRVTSASLSVKTSFGAETVGWPNIQSLALGRVDPAQATLKIWGREPLQGRLLDDEIGFTLAEGAALKLQVASLQSLTAAP